MKKHLAILSLILGSILYVTSCTKEEFNSKVNINGETSSGLRTIELTAEEIGIAHYNGLELLYEKFHHDSTTAWPEHVNDIIVELRAFAIANDLFMETDDKDQIMDDVRTMLWDWESIITESQDSLRWIQVTDSLTDNGVISEEISTALQDFWVFRIVSESTARSANEDIFLKRTYTRNADQRVAELIFNILDGSITFYYSNDEGNERKWDCTDWAYLGDAIGAVSGVAFSGGLASGLIGVGFSWGFSRECRYGSIL